MSARRRADLYLARAGTAVWAGRVSGATATTRLVSVIPKRALDPVARGRKCRARRAPSAKIAKRFPQVGRPLKEPAKDTRNAPSRRKPLRLRLQQHRGTATSARQPPKSAASAGFPENNADRPTPVAADGSTAKDWRRRVKCGLPAHYATDERRRPLIPDLSMRHAAKRGLSEEERADMGWRSQSRSSQYARNTATMKTRWAAPAAELEIAKKACSPMSRPAASLRIAPGPEPASPALAPLGRRERATAFERPEWRSDARIDLHGMDADPGRTPRLVRLSATRPGDGLTFVLVINGQGQGGPLNRAWRACAARSRWLRLPDSVAVIGFEEAHIGQGRRGRAVCAVRRSRIVICFFLNARTIADSRIQVMISRQIMVWSGRYPISLPLSRDAADFHRVQDQEKGHSTVRNPAR